MKIVPFRIPKVIVLPGLVVTVKLVPAFQLAEADADWSYDGSGQALIRIRRGLPIERKRYLLIHELQHVMTDYLHMALQEHPDTIHP